MATASSETLSTLDKALAVLTSFSPRHPEWGVTELAQHLQINKTTVHKVLATYQHWGMLQQDAESRKYRLSLRLVELAQAVSPRQELRSAALPEMERLAIHLGETAKLSVPDRDEVFCLEAVESQEQMRMTGQAGRRNPLYAGASNKLILAHMPWGVVQRVIWERTPADHPIRRDPEAFRTELEALVAAGYAISTNEVEDGVTAISAPIRDFTGEVIASISIAGPSTRLHPSRYETLIKQVCMGATAVSRRLGFSRDLS